MSPGLQILLLKSYLGQIRRSSLRSGDKDNFDDVTYNFGDGGAGWEIVSVDSFDPVERPKHYAEGRKIEPIDVIEDWSLNYHLGNALKYISRAGRKGEEVEDLKKAVWYLNRRIEKLKC